MKAIQIDIKGMSPKFAAIVSENKYGFCYMSDKVLAGEADFAEDYAKNMRVLRDLAESTIRGALDEKQFNV